MSIAVITGWGVVHRLGMGAAAFTRGVWSVVHGRAGGRQTTLGEYQITEHLGRRGIGSLDRVAGFAVHAGGLTLEDAGLEVDEEIRDDVGVVLASHAGSMQSTADVVGASYTGRRPFDVPPQLFPNGALSASAAWVAMRYGLQGVNATVSSGQVSALAAMAYAQNMLRNGQASIVLTGAAYEHTVYSSVLAEHARHQYGVTLPQGEGAALFAVELADRVPGQRVCAEILAVDVRGASLPCSQSEIATALGDCIGAALRSAGVSPGEVWAAVTGENGSPVWDRTERQGVCLGLGREPARWVPAKQWVGEMWGAAGAFQLAVILGLVRVDPSGDEETVCVLTSVDPAGPVGALVVRVLLPTRGVA